MCRWMAWLGQSLVLETLLFEAPHGIVDQSLEARMGAEPTDGDGFGVGWYGIGERPGVFRSVALTFGLEHDPLAALERTVGFIEGLARERGIEDPVQASFGVSDGESLWAVRYASDGSARSLFVSADPERTRHLHPENPRLARLSPDDRLVVSEPFSDLPGVWEPVPEETALTVRREGVLETRPFTPRADELG